MMTINLPVGTIRSIINIDDPRVKIPFEDAYDYLNQEGDKYIRTMETSYSIVDVPYKEKYWKTVKFNHSTSFINKIKKVEIANNPNMKYFKAVLKYENGNEQEMIVPGFVKFFSRISKNFIPIEFIGKADILYDYQGHYVMVKSCEEIKFKPTEYYNIHVNNNSDLQTPFYYNGIYSYIYYINFFNNIIKDYSTNTEESK